MSNHFEVTDIKTGTKFNSADEIEKWVIDKAYTGQRQVQTVVYANHRKQTIIKVEAGLVDCSHIQFMHILDTNPELANEWLNKILDKKRDEF